MIKASVNKKPAPIENDTKGGSIGYNRLDMQVSQALHMAIELYPNLNYLLIMDHYDSNFQTGFDVPTNIITLTERKKLLLEQDYIEHKKEISTWFELLKK